MKKFSQITSLMTGVFLITLFSGCSSVQMVPANARSNHFDTVSSHLDLGGEVYMYTDIEGDIDKVAAFADEALKQSGELSEDIADKIDIKKMVSSLGLSQIGAVGLSSYEKNNRFINKSFVSVEGKRKGLLTIAGDKPHKFELPEFAPNGVSIAFEEDINLKTFFEMMIEIIKDIPGSEEFDELMTKLNEPIAPGLFSTMDIIEKADTKIMMAVKMDKEKMVTIPDEDFRFPYTDAVISIDNMGFIVPKLIEMVKDSGLFSIKEFDKYQSIHLVQEFPGDMSSYSPIMQRDKETNRLYIATTPAFLSKCLGTDNKLSGDKSYQVAVADLPVNEGNALSYISPEFSGFVSSILKEALHNEKKLKFIAGLIDEQLKDSNIPQASVLKVEENGIYSVSSSAYSHKLTFLALGYFNPVTLGIIAAASISSIF